MAKNTNDDIKKVLVDAAIDVTAKILKIFLPRKGLFFCANGRLARE